MRVTKLLPAATLALLLLPTSVALAGTNLGVETTVRTYFADTPVMAAIAACESEFHQFNSDGSVLHGGYKHRMIGLFQIAPLHLPTTKALGLDVDTVAGNMAYAKYLYEHEGTRPWLDSSWCWQKKMEAAAKDESAKLAMLQKQIVHLTAVLNALIAARKSAT